MPHVYARLFYHFVWATWDRLPLLEGAVERHAYALIREQCKRLGCEAHALGGIEDHVHLLVTLPRTLCISDFVEAVKGCSSRGLNEAHGSNGAFKWQGGYGVLTVSPRDVNRVRRYVESQRQHHSRGTLWSSAEKVVDEPALDDPPPGG